MFQSTMVLVTLYSWCCSSCWSSGCQVQNFRAKALVSKDQHSMPRPLVFVDGRDSVAQPLGAAWLMKELDDELVRVKFVVGRRKYVVRRAHVNFGNKDSPGTVQKKKRAHEERALSSNSPPFVPSSASSPTIVGESSDKPIDKPSDKPKKRRSKKPRSQPTWDRLLRFGAVCDANNVYSEQGLRSLSSLLLPDGVLSWLDTLPASTSFTSSMRSFVDIWCTYCGALAHCDYSAMETREKLLVLNLVCDDIESGGGSGNVFASLLMQCLVSGRHDQSVCSVVADLDNIGYAKRVDRAKPGVLVSSLALLRHESGYPAAKRAMDKFRAPLTRAVWQVKSNEQATTFLRLARNRLYCFPTDSGVSSRLHPVTNEIRYWSAESETYVPKKEFYTTVDGVSFKKVVNLANGDRVLNKDAGGFYTQTLISSEICGEKAKLVLEYANSRISVHKPKHAYVLTGDGTNGRDVACLLKECPDVTHTLCMSVGHPKEYMKKRRGGGVLSDCKTRPIQLSFEEYVVWRCAVAASVAGMSGRHKKKATAKSLEARTHLLVETSYGV